MAASKNLVRRSLTGQKCTTLISAIKEGNIQSVTTQIQADPWLLHEAVAIRRTAFRIAIQYGHTKIITLLLENGVHINEPIGYSQTDGRFFNGNGKDDTPLLYAISTVKLSVIPFLMEKGADANKPNRDGNTALHYAIYYLHFPYEPLLGKVIPFLFEYGADATMKNKNGQTPIDLAQAYNYPQLAEFVTRCSKYRDMWQLWEMETPEYNNYFQWLPREIIEEVIPWATTPKP
ncbi:MAG: hypothetical protein K0R48_790 [Gammaproteobacteria bacterium]|nr:hypothetical protein [Gammaproteobacteria bacterium]